MAILVALFGKKAGEKRERIGVKAGGERERSGAWAGWFRERVGQWAKREGVAGRLQSVALRGLGVREEEFRTQNTEFRMRAGRARRKGAGGAAVSESGH